ncbi:hypothetical protein RclHR1_32620002 [Rhizophagus clarus]|uniref:SAM domain-containing protein n=1 Tax=Rhizophagus clarus TaxID=94130 RepID=A0A2Z6R8P9_9GLOM|nr:hypothetical protein RclHR1_32620002 [Rhizophagus clarus]GES79395.1 hypothetical protein GLOIN_2v1479040 [Rhizophagus clarus]
MFFAITSQMVPFAQNSSASSSSILLLSLPKQAICSLDEFFARFDESNSIRELVQFKNIFEDEQITVNQIHDLTDAEFDQLGVKKIG